MERAIARMSQSICDLLEGSMQALYLYGSVTMDDFQLWKKALQGKDNVTWKSYKGLNHIFIPAGDPPLPSDYAKQGTMPAEVADDIAKFVKGL